MKIGGFQKTSLLDYPGKISSIVFTVGCNLRCHFCYVPQLVLPERISEIEEIPEEYVFSYLRENKRFIDAVVITGGEPTIHQDLPDFIRKIKGMGFLVGLETNGTNPQMLRELIDGKFVDYVEMDLKNKLDFDSYKKIVGDALTKEMFENIKSSVEILLNPGIESEFRTTLVKEFHSKEDILEICKTLSKAREYYLQNLKDIKDLVGGNELTGFTDEEIKNIVSEGKKFANVIKRKV